jgi:hypothetical protein
MFISLLCFCFICIGMTTLKLNKGKLRKLAQAGEVTVAQVSLKRKKVDEGSSKRAEEAPSRPPIRDAVPLVEAVPPVIMVDVDLAPPANPSMATINQSFHVAMDRAKGAVSSRDMDDYAAAHTEDVHYLLIHSLMQVGFFFFFIIIIFFLVFLASHLIFCVFVGPE